MGGEMGMAGINYSAVYRVYGHLRLTSSAVSYSTMPQPLERPGKGERQETRGRRD